MPAARPVDVVVDVEGGEHEHLRGRAEGADQAGRLQPVEVGHAHVHEHDVGLEAAGQAHRLVAVLGLAHHLDVGLRVEFTVR
jgi:hypothetical protein